MCGIGSLGYIHPLAASAFKAWMNGEMAVNEAGRYMFLVQSKLIPVVECMMEIGTLSLSAGV